MTKILLLSSSLLMGTLVQATEITTTNSISPTTGPSGIVSTSGSTRANGWYVGAGTGLMNFGGEVIVDDGYETITIDIDTEDKPIMLKVGYVTDSENRIELYYKNDSIDVVNGSQQAELYETSTFGINYQWGISSLSTDKMLPYIRVGIGFGSAEATDVAVDLDAVEFDLGAGVHYEVAPNIDLSVGIYRRAIGITTENSDDSIISAVNGIEIGANYHF